MRRLIFAFFGTMFTLVVLGSVGFVVLVVQHYNKDLPSHKELARYEPPITTRLYAADGRLMAEYADEKRVFVPIEAFPRKVIHAFLAAEDKNFYKHPGVDFLGVVRAVVQNISNIGTGRRLVGASTITQQVAKNFLLSDEVSLERKVREAILAFRIERTYTKDKILELYLNEIFLGFGSYGAAAASLNYFSKSLDELSTAEVAYLAALPKAPNNYHPKRRYDAALARRNWVIDRMVEEKYISPLEGQEAKAEPLTVIRRDRSEIVTAEYFSEEIRRILIDRYGRESLYDGGLSVRTTLDSQLQEIAQRSLQQGLINYDRRHGWRGPITKIQDPENWLVRLRELPSPEGLRHWQQAAVLEVDRKEAKIGFADGATGVIPMSEMAWARPWRPEQRVGAKPKRPNQVVAVGDVVPVDTTDKEGVFALQQIPEIQGALVAIDPHTGRVLAMQGGFTFSHEGNSFNRATQALRQPGSAFKPFVYMAGLEDGLTPATIVIDAPFVLCQSPDKPCWKPTNFSGVTYGPTPMRKGIEKSRNLMTVRLAQTVGMDKVREMSARFGVIENMPKYLPMALGAGETTLLRMTTAYAKIVNGGKQIYPSLIDRVQDRRGQTIYRHDKRACNGCQAVEWNGQPMPLLEDAREQLISEETAYQMVSMLQGVVQRGTGARIGKALKRPLAGKTGTTNNAFDTWFIGFSPDIAVGVFVGFDQPRTLGPKETGSRVAAPIFQAFMKDALEQQAKVPFRIPSGIRMVRVDPDQGTRCRRGSKGCIMEAFKPGTEPKPGVRTVAPQYAGELWRDQGDGTITSLPWQPRAGQVRGSAYPGTQTGAVPGSFGGAATGAATVTPRLRGSQLGVWPTARPVQPVPAPLPTPTPNVQTGIQPLPRGAFPGSLPSASVPAPLPAPLPRAGLPVPGAAGVPGATPGWQPGSTQTQQQPSGGTGGLY